MEDLKNHEKTMSEILALGKVRTDVMRQAVFPFIPLEEEPSLDGGAIQLNGRTIVSHSPSIGVPLNALGFFAFHYSASNVASLFAKPKHMVIGIYLPIKSREEDLKIIAKGFGDEAKRYNVTIVAGQTATYNGLEIPLITSTCLGEQVRRPKRPRKGDDIVVIGNVGGESLWLIELSRGNVDYEWRRFTPLDAALSLQEYRGVKMMHDVSEGGVKGALKEMADALGYRFEVESESLPYEEGIRQTVTDVLSSPTYGTLISIVCPNFTEDVIEICGKIGYPSSVIGVIKGGEGLYIDGKRVEDIGRTNIDELYGIFEPNL